MESKEIHRLLPEEIITDILSILSVKSLLRFKCVSKSWRRLISSRYFIKTYLQNSKKNETFDHTTMIISAPPKTSKSGGMIKACSLWSLLMEPVTHASPLDYIIPWNRARDILIVGSCNGLICVLVLDNYQFLFLLWNPLTRECKRLPDFFDGVNHDKKLCLTGAHGFAFDESCGDYKIYFVFRMRFTSVARIYSLNADSWGEVKSLKDESMFGLGRFVSGKLHWRSDFKLGSNWEIGTLDLKSETFGIVKQPNCLKDYISPRLGVLKGCLCVYFNYPKNITIGFDIWIWNEYGVEDSWSRLLTIPYLCVTWRFLESYKHVTPLLVLPTDEVLFTYALSFYTYNPKDNVVRKLGAVDFDCSDACEPHVYTESLVSLSNPRNNGVISSTAKFSILLEFDI